MNANRQAKSDELGLFFLLLLPFTRPDKEQKKKKKTGKQ